MLKLDDKDEGKVLVMAGGAEVIAFEYDTEDRKSQKAAHAQGRAFIAGWAARSAVAVVGYEDGAPIYAKFNAAGIPVFEGRAA